MKFYGQTTLTAYYPVPTRYRAIELVRNNNFDFSNGVIGFAIYLYTYKNLSYVVGDWTVECLASFRNLAGISLNNKEFDDLFGIPYEENSSWTLHNLRQKRVINWAGYDGLLLDDSMLVVFGCINQVRAIKASPKPNEIGKNGSYNRIIEKLKTISKVFRRRRYGNSNSHRL